MNNFKGTFSARNMGILACVVGGIYATAQYAGGEKNCIKAPTPNEVLEKRKKEAHALSEGQSSEFHLRRNSPQKPSSWKEYVRDESAAVMLGKALFWEQRVSSNNKVACATCHHSGGVDSRTNGAFSYTDTNGGVAFDPKKNWKTADAGDGGRGVMELGYIKGNSTEVIGSRGIEWREFTGLNPADKTKELSRDIDLAKYNEEDQAHRNKLFGTGDTAHVTNRNGGTVINAIFHTRLFHDGRASFYFNGVDPFGERSSEWNEKSLFRVVNGNRVPVAVKIAGAAAASQALAPVLNTVEMSYEGRDFIDVAQKLLPAKVLAEQKISPTDSVLKEFAAGERVTYAELVQRAFDPSWWKDDARTINAGNKRDENRKATMMEANFSMFFGLAIMAYESTLVSDDAPFDQYQRGNTAAMSDLALVGEQLFNLVGCADCHEMPTFAGATGLGDELLGGGAGGEEAAEEEAKELEDYLTYYVGDGVRRPVPIARPLNPDGLPLVEAMQFEYKAPVTYDGFPMVWRPYDVGFYNLGVTGLRLDAPASGGGKPWDFGVGGVLRFGKDDDDGGGGGGGDIKANAIARLAEKRNTLNTLPRSEARAFNRGIGGIKPRDERVALLSYAEERYNDRAAAEGGFKTPTLRNVALTAPYMHNGAFASLSQVMKFYKMGPRVFKNGGLPAGEQDAAAQFIHPELRFLRAALRMADPYSQQTIRELGVEGAKELAAIMPTIKALDSAAGAEGIDGAIVAFMLSLTDERVAKRAAPFDHPSLKPGSDGFELKEVGREGVADPNAVKSEWTKRRESLD
jgi:cytochrome c peroxidase